MQLRTIQRHNRDGTAEVRYVQLVHNRRAKGVTQAKGLLNLGREVAWTRTVWPGSSSPQTSCTAGSGRTQRNGP